MNYTHSLLSAMLLKTGLVGIAMCGGYLYALARAGFVILRLNSTLGLAVAIPIAIDVFLYAAYKSLGFGMLLSLVVIYAHVLAREAALKVAKAV